MKRSFLKIISLLLVCMVVLSACGGPSNRSNSSNGGNEGADKSAKLEELTVVLPVAGTISKDLQMVEDAINTIAMEKIHAKVKFLHISFGDWEQQTNLMYAGNEKMDLIWISGSNYTNLVAKGQLQAMDDLFADHGQGITAAIDQSYLGATKIGGKTYAVPTVRDFASSTGVNMNKALVDKYRIDVNGIKSLDDLEQVLRTVKEGEGPEMYPLVPGANGRTFLDDLNNFDALSDSIGVLPNYDNGLKVVNYYESQKYADFLNKIRGWFMDGLIPKDVATSQTSRVDLIKANKAFAYSAKLNPVSKVTETALVGQEMEPAEIYPAVATTSSVTGSMWAIPVNSTIPDKAMDFLNLMYSDKDVVNLYDWGIEGTHYVKVDGMDNVIAYPEGVDKADLGYSMPMGWMFGNQFLSYVQQGNDPEVWTKMKAFNDGAGRSKALGFLFDATPVKTEYAAVTNVITQYKIPLETGSVDPAKILPEFISKLKSAGIDKIIAEKQKQLDEWAQANGVN
ncbi:ABC transporter substrate-binding protein [Paenibacillus sp. 79R4]|uniref:ABC transporter substrate-binding protein n=1 Tax=Paenibacillus sp. 79R4 TaxID=2212847 RepID=UPI0015BBF4F7|nr:ABC transporter substrate-binding protein [Paenibacillus sp. 79R4]NWL86305.1 ABC transporter substrate-binding protein [Paenibacillus sp. 79R4]